MANIGNLRKRAKQIENPTGLPDEDGIESIISNAARNSSEEIIESSIANDLASLIETESTPVEKPASDEVPIPEFKMPEPEPDDDDEDFDLPEIKAPEEPAAKPLPVEPEPHLEPEKPTQTLPDLHKKSKGLPTRPLTSKNDPGDLWMFNQIAIQMINEAREIIKPDGIDSEKYWDEILNRVQK